MTIHRRGVQITRMLLLMRLLETSPPMPISQIKRKLKDEVCERTIRRDLMVFYKLNWVLPFDGEDGKTQWRWILER
jgi:hypothetical protein